MIFFIVLAVVGIVCVLVGILGMKKASKKMILLPVGIIICAGCLYALFVASFVPYGPGIYDYTYYINQDYCIVRSSSKNVVLCDEDLFVLIHANIVGLGYNEKHIIVKQEPDRSKDDRNASKRPVAGNRYAYWIVEIETGQVMGPFSKNEFIQKRDELGVAGGMLFSSPDEIKS